MADLTGRIIGALQADVKTFEEIEADPNAMGQAVTVILLAGVSSLIGHIRLGIVPGAIGLAVSLGGYALFSLLVVIIGTKLMPEPSTKADFSEAFRTIGFTAAPGIFAILAIIPILGYLVSFVIMIWTLVVAVIAVRAVLDYSNTGRAIIVCVLAGAACLIVYFLVMVPILTLLFVARAATAG